jgi:2-phosphosulfolactate phosphatase
MRITTSLLPAVSDCPEPTDAAVVIDVLRATSVMATALSAGANQIITCREVDTAIEIADRLDPRPLLCGERNCVLIPGFDFGNSPAEYTIDNVSGKTLVLTTTNGTAAIETAASAPQVVVASFLNLSAVVEALQSYQTIRLICAGTNGFLSNEDILLAGALIACCETRYGAGSDGDASILATQLWRSWFPVDRYPADRLPNPDDLTASMRETRGGRNLIRVGFERDIDRCAAVDSLTVVPRLCGQDPLTFA